MVYSTERPDINGGQPMMLSLVKLFNTNPDTERIPFYKVWCDDNTISSIEIKIALDPRSTWKNKLYINSRHILFSVIPASGNRYYCIGEEITIKVDAFSNDFKQITGFKKFRKYTGTPEQCADKLKKWVLTTVELINA